MGMKKEKQIIFKQNDKKNCLHSEEKGNIYFSLRYMASNFFLVEFIFISLQPTSQYLTITFFHNFLKLATLTQLQLTKQ